MKPLFTDYSAGLKVDFTQSRKDRKDAKAGQILQAFPKHLTRLCVFAIFASLREPLFLNAEHVNQLLHR